MNLKKNLENCVRIENKARLKNDKLPPSKRQKIGEHLHVQRPKRMFVINLKMKKDRKRDLKYSRITQKTTI